MIQRYIYFIGFSGYPEFPNTNILSRFYSASDIVVDSIDNATVLIIGNFVKLPELQSILNFKGVKILYISEPITRFEFARLADYLFEKNLCDYYIGCVSYGPKYIKYPGPKYIKYPGPKYIKYPFYVHNPIDFDAANNYVLNTDIFAKQFCTLINRHDPGLSRVPIYNLLSKISHISCPGKLLNNCSNEELNRIGNAEWCKKFIFNICSENFYSHEGYITEKLLNCVLGGAIPIYMGELDSVDVRVFNKNRILFFNDENKYDVVNYVLYLLNNPNKLVEYYRQPVFMPTAQLEFDNMIANMKSWWESF